MYIVGSTKSTQDLSCILPPSEEDLIQSLSHFLSHEVMHQATILHLELKGQLSLMYNLSVTVVAPFELEYPVVSATWLWSRYMWSSSISDTACGVSLLRRASHSLSITDPSSKLPLKPTTYCLDNLRPWDSFLYTTKLHWSQKRDLLLYQVLPLSPELLERTKDLTHGLSELDQHHLGELITDCLIVLETTQGRKLSLVHMHPKVLDPRTNCHCPKQITW